jgi:hypothetical protein
MWILLGQLRLAHEIMHFQRDLIDSAETFQQLARIGAVSAFQRILALGNITICTGRSTLNAWRICFSILSFNRDMLAP